MRYKSFVYIFVLALLTFFLPTALFAQAPALSETYTAPDNSFTVKYASGWSPTFTADDPTDVIFFTGDDNGTRIAVQIGKTSAKTLTDAIPSMKQQLTINEDPIVVDANGRQALYVFGGPYKQLYAAVLFDNGKIAYFVINPDPKNLDTWKSTLLSVAASLDIVGANPVVGTPASGEAEATTQAIPAEVTSLSPALVWTVKMRGQNIQDVAFSPDGKIVAATGTLGTSGQPTDDIVLLDATSGKLLHDLAGHTGLIYRIAFSPDGTLLASASSDNTLRVWDVASGTQKLNIQETGQLHSVAFSPNGASVAFMTNSNPNTIWLLDVASGKAQQVYTSDGASFTVNSMIFGEDNGSVIFDATEYTNGNGDAVVYALSLADQQTKKLFDQPGLTPLDVFYTPYHQLLSVVAPADSKGVQVWNVNTGSMLYALPPAKASDGTEVGTVRAVLNPAGTILATISIGTEIQLWDAQTGSLLGTLNRNIDVGQDGPQGVAFSADGKWVASSYEYGSAVLWNLSAASSQTQAATSTDVTATAPSTSAGTAGASCTITAPQTANLRSGPATTFAKAGSLNAGQTADVDGQAQSSDGKTWYRTSAGTWVRSDLVTAPAECANVPTVTP